MDYVCLHKGDCLFATEMSTKVWNCAKALLKIRSYLFLLEMTRFEMVRMETVKKCKPLQNKQPLALFYEFKNTKLTPS